MHPLPPRAHYLAAPVTRPDKASLSPEEVLERGLPPAVTAVTGPVHAVTLPPQGVCSAVLRLQADKGTFLVKWPGAGTGSGSYGPNTR